MEKTERLGGEVTQSKRRGTCELVDADVEGEPRTLGQLGGQPGLHSGRGHSARRRRRLWLAAPLAQRAQRIGPVMIRCHQAGESDSATCHGVPRHHQINRRNQSKQSQ